MVLGQRLYLGVLVGQHDPRVADADLGVMDLAGRVVHAHHLTGAERLFVERNGLAGAA
jgi:hypothetical protein